MKPRRPRRAAIAPSMPMPVTAPPSTARPRSAPGLPMWLATLLALAVSASVFLFAMQWRGLIIFVAVCTGLFFGMRYLCRRHPLVAVFLIAFMRGFFGRR